jgi:4'-phosphopantetheinyl transferase
MLEMDSVELDASLIHLWWLDMSQITDPSLLEEYRALLTDHERAREQRFYFPDGRKQYMLTRALVRTTLSRFAPIAPGDWSFADTEYGRPEITTSHPAIRGLVFNVSHTKDCIVLAVTRDRALGVDVESLQKSRAGLDLATRVFTPREVAFMRALPDTRHPEHFLELWTLKEAYIKARGMGLSLAPERFGFELADDSTLSIYLDADLNDAADRWWFQQWRLTDDHILALCCERQSTAPRVALKQIVPMKWEQTIDRTLVRQSRAHSPD